MINAPVRRLPLTTHQPDINANPVMQDIRLENNPLILIRTWEPALEKSHLALGMTMYPLFKLHLPLGAKYL